jgi:hypothetical protein
MPGHLDIFWSEHHTRDQAQERRLQSFEMTDPALCHCVISNANEKSLTPTGRCGRAKGLASMPR